MKTPDIHLRIKSDAKLLMPVRGMLRSFLERMDLSEPKANEVVLAVDEACANSIRHSYKGKPDGIVDLKFIETSSVIKIVISDDGEPIDIDQTKKKKQGKITVSDLEVGGRGISFMQYVFDKVEFCPGDKHGNCVSMSLRRKKRKKK